MIAKACLRLRTITPIGAAVAGALALCPAHDARAVGFASSAPATPLEERIALAISPERSVLFSQLRFDTRGADVAIIVPVQLGASLDWSSRALFEALEVATAPRIVGPDGNDTCPGTEQVAVHIAGDDEGLETLQPQEVLVLPDAASVESFAQAHGLTVSPALSAGLVAEQGMQFFVARFSAPSGVSLTRPLRVVFPGPVVRLPLVLSEAGNEELRITTWAVGSGRAALSGEPVTVDLSKLTLEAGPETSNFDDLLSDALAPPGSVLLGMSSHQSLSFDLELGSQGPFVKSFVRSYFERAAAYGETQDQPSICAQQATVVLGQSAQVGTTCPRSELGVVGGAAPCAVDDVAPGEVDPALLRCGAQVDDVAVLLSDLVPDEAWLTRATVLVQPAGSGNDREFSFETGAAMDPIFVASSIDLSDCSEGGGGSGSSSGPGSTGAGAASSGSGLSSSSGGTVDVPVYVLEGCGSCAENSYVLANYVEVDADSAPEAYYEGDDCSAESSGTYAGDDCSGDSFSGSDSYDLSADSCDCSDTSGTFADEGCSCGDSGYADACSGESFGDACDCGGESLCTTGKSRGHVARTPRKASGFVYATLVVLVPLRRLTARRRRASASARPTKR